VVPAQVAGLIALAVALLLTMTRLSSRRRPGSKTSKTSKSAKNAEATDKKPADAAASGPENPKSS
jgi:hypothetical protein